MMTRDELYASLKEALVADQESLDADMADLNETLEANKDRLATLEISKSDAQTVLSGLSDSKSEIEANIAKILQEQQEESRKAMEAAKKKSSGGSSSSNSSGSSESSKAYADCSYSF